jgi:hypothetical protein
MNDFSRKDMTCEAVRDQFSLLLYGELSFDDEERVESHLDACGECRTALERERSMHVAVDSIEIGPSPSLLRVCREELRARLLEEKAEEEFQPRRAAAGGSSWWDQFVDKITGRSVNAWHGPFQGWMKPAGALSLIAIGFLAARVTPLLQLGPENSPFTKSSIAEPGASRVRYVEPGSDGRVQIVLDETRQRVISGRLDDQPIRALLLAAAKDPADPGLRTESVNILNARAQSADVRDALIYALRRDQNSGVRLKALEGLRPYAQEPDVRSALAEVLLKDSNPGVRTQAIDLLTADAGGGARGRQMVDRQVIGMLQELMHREDNSYIRDRCRRILEAMNASVETF